jgi:hypothetical protein
MTVAAFERAFHESASGPGGREVWVVTVHAPVTDDGSPAAPPKQHGVYSIVINATTGTGTDGCAGCDWVKADQ